MDTQQTPPQDAASEPKAPQVVQSVPSGAAPAFDAKDIQENKLMAALSYLGILVFIPLFLAKKSAFAQEHAKQGVILLAIHILGMFLFWIPVLGQILWIIVVIANIVALVKCLMGEFWEIPVLGQYRKMVNF
jgi:uncharacterized membrane protein